MPTRLLKILLFGTLATSLSDLSVEAASAQELSLHARKRVKNEAGEFILREETVQWDAQKTAIVVCDMWNQHWCRGATRRVAEMAPRMNQVLRAARRRGVFIIHAPSDTLKFYQDTSQRKLAQSAPPVPPRVPLQRWCNLDRGREAPLPIDDADGGCDCSPKCPSGSPWTRQIDTLEIKEGDAITDSAEAYYLMQQRGIENVIVMGVHLNMCVLGRPFSIRQMVNQGKNVLLMRDLTDTMYNSRSRPYVSHCRGTDLVTEHVEKYWCGSITSVDFLGGEPFLFLEDKRYNIVFLVGENEYQTERTLPEFARAELEWRGFNCLFAHANPDGGNEFAGIEAVKRADLLFLSVRRRTPPKAHLELIREHLRAGKPLVGIRTASHAFGAQPPDDEHADWPAFDVEILGANYQMHYGNKPPKDPPTLVRVVPQAAQHPVVTGLPTNEFPVTSHLYKNRNTAPTVTVLMKGQVEGHQETEPVAWVNRAGQRRVFYTSLGNPDDFRLPAFRRLLLNGILWSLDQPVPPP